MRSRPRAKCSAVSTAMSRLCLRRPSCIECDACIDICPLQCLTITRDGDEAELRDRLSAPAVNPDQALYASEPLPQTGRVDGERRRSLCPLRPVRRTLPHRGLGHAKVRTPDSYAECGRNPRCRT